MDFTAKDNQNFTWAFMPENDTNSSALELRKMAKDSNWKPMNIGMPSDTIGLGSSTIENEQEPIDSTNWDATKDFMTTPQDDALKSYGSGLAEGLTGNLYKTIPTVALDAVKTIGQQWGMSEEDQKSLDNIISNVKDFDKSAKEAYPVFNKVGKILGFVFPGGIAVKGYGLLSRGTNFVPKLIEKLAPQSPRIAGAVGRFAKETIVGTALSSGLQTTENLDTISDDPKKALDEFLTNIPDNAKVASMFGALSAGQPEAVAWMEKNLPKAFAAARGISPEVVQVYNNPSDRSAIKTMMKMDRKTLITNLEDRANTQLTKFVTSRNARIDQLLSSIKGDVNLRPVATEVRTFINELKDINVKDKLVQNAIDELERYATEFTDKIPPSKILNVKGEPAIKGKVVTKSDTVSGLNDMRKRLNDLSSALYKQTEIKLPPMVESRLAEISQSTRKLMIDAISKQSSTKAKIVDKYLTDLHDLIGMQKEVNFKSVYSMEEPATDMGKMAKIAQRWAGVKEQGINEMATLEAMDKKIGGTISRDAKRYLALKQLSNWDIISGFATGRSAAPYTAIESMVGGTGMPSLLARALGGLWWLHTAPVTTKGIITGYGNIWRAGKQYGPEVMQGMKAGIYGGRSDAINIESILKEREDKRNKLRDENTTY